jgi:hypothetical protein
VRAEASPQPHRLPQGFVGGLCDNGCMDPCRHPQRKRHAQRRHQPRSTPLWVGDPEDWAVVRQSPLPPQQQVQPTVLPIQVRRPHAAGRRSVQDSGTLFNGEGLTTHRDYGRDQWKRSCDREAQAVADDDPPSDLAGLVAAAEPHPRIAFQPRKFNHIRSLSAAYTVSELWLSLNPWIGSVRGRRGYEESAL